MNSYMYYDYKRKDFFSLNKQRMTCEIARYSNSKLLSFLLVIVPIITVQVFALYVFIIGNRYLKSYPENVTNMIRTEITFFPIFILVSYAPKLAKHTAKLIY